MVHTYLYLTILKQNLNKLIKTVLKSWEIVMLGESFYIFRQLPVIYVPKSFTKDVFIISLIFELIVIIMSSVGT